MNNKKEILSELQGISPLLASISRAPVYALPEGYFDDLSGNISLKIENEVNKEFSKNQVQDVPEGYFEHLSGQILSKINSGEVVAADEDTEIKAYPVLASLKNKSSYLAPEGYFDQIGAHVMERVESKPAKVVPFSRWWKYAAAAVVIGWVFLAAWPWLQGNSNQEPAVAMVQAHDNLPLELASQFNTTEKIHEGIESLSDDAIAGYLADHGSILDNELLIKGMEVQGMPDAMDYILQDDALSNYLDQLQRPG